MTASIVKRFNSLGIKPEVLKRYDEPHRFYHNWEHIQSMLDQYKREKPSNYGPTADNIMFAAIVFHDIIYDPLAQDNEQLSALLFEESLCTHNVFKSDSVRIVQNMILETKNHRPTSDLSSFLCKLDLAILTAPLEQQIAFENKIFKEYQYYSSTAYKEGRIGILKGLQKGTELNSLIEYVKAFRPNIGIYTGSFNPFHRGHLDVLQKAEKVFDKVILAQGRNPEKVTYFAPLPEAVRFHEQQKYYGLITDFVKSLPTDADYTLVRGLRNGSDLAYEMTQYRFIQDLMPELGVTFIPCDKEYEHISSSAVRYLCTVNAAEPYLVK